MRLILANGKRRVIHLIWQPEPLGGICPTIRPPKLICLINAIETNFQHANERHTSSARALAFGRVLDAWTCLISQSATNFGSSNWINTNEVSSLPVSNKDTYLFWWISFVFGLLFNIWWVLKKYQSEEVHFFKKGKSIFFLNRYITTTMDYMRTENLFVFNNLLKFSNYNSIIIILSLSNYFHLKTYSKPF